MIKFYILRRISSGMSDSDITLGTSFSGLGLGLGLRLGEELGDLELLELDLERCCRFRCVL